MLSRSIFMEAWCALCVICAACVAGMHVGVVCMREADQNYGEVTEIGHVPPTEKKNLTQ